jgi:hypothetical protein
MGRQVRRVSCRRRPLARRPKAKIETGEGEFFRQELRPIPLAFIADADKVEFGGDCGMDY